MPVQKGSLLPSSAQPKMRDRCYVKAGCMHGGADDTPQKATKGSIVAAQEFNGQTFYHVLIDGKGPPAFWYAADCLIMKQGQLPKLRKDNQRWCVVQKGNYSARFLLDRVGVDSYIGEQFDVYLDDDTEPS